MRSIIEVKQNLKLVARERGKIVARREGHNIFLNVGMDWLALIVSYQTLPAIGVAPTHPNDAYEYHRIRYMGFGIGGSRQTAPSALFTASPFDAYPWNDHTFVQGDDDPTVYALESPVPVLATGGAYPNDYQWFGQVGAPPELPSTGQVKYSRIFTETDLTFGLASLIPLSEIGLFTNAAVYNAKPEASGAMVAYDTFNTLNKTNAIAIEIEWTLKF
jgi:hypothetical protein